MQGGVGSAADGPIADSAELNRAYCVKTGEAYGQAAFMSSYR